MIDKHPAAIARCRDAADVIACVRFAREHGLEIAVRGGGHNAAGLGVWDDALVIDLSLMRSTTVSPENHTVRVDAGCTWGDVDHATVAFGMATPSGVPGLHRRGRPDPRRRHRLPVPALRADGRQPARRRRGARRRHVRDRQRELAPRPVLGAARRRRQLRHRHLVHVPLPRHRRERHDHRRPGPLRLRRHRRGDALVPGAAAVAARGAERLDRRCSPSRPRRRSPRSCGAASRARIVWCYTGAARPGRRGARAGQDVRLAAAWSACSRCRSPCCRAPSTPSTRPGCSGTGGRTSSTRSPTRRSRCTSSTARSCRPATPPCTCTPSTAPPAGCRHDATAFAYRDGGWAGRHRRRRPRPRPTPADLAVGPGLLGRSCTRPRPAAPTSTS